MVGWSVEDTRVLISLERCREFFLPFVVVLYSHLVHTFCFVDFVPYS